MSAGDAGEKAATPKPPAEGPEAAKLPGMPSEKDYEGRRVYREAYGKVLKDFLHGHLKNAKGDEIKDKDEAHSIAEIEGRKAVAAMKKTGMKLSVFVD